MSRRITVFSFIIAAYILITVVSGAYAGYTPSIPSNSESFDSPNPPPTPPAPPDPPDPPTPPEPPAPPPEPPAPPPEPDLLDDVPPDGYTHSDDVAPYFETKVSADIEVIRKLVKANDELASSDITIYLGNDQSPIPPEALPDGAVLVTDVDDVDVIIKEPEPDRLPVCFEPSGKNTAEVTIQQGAPGPSALRRTDSGGGGWAIIPMSYRIKISRAELVSAFCEEIAGEILASPMSHLDLIFKKFVIQQEIRQGERLGWYTRFIKGLLSPEEAVSKGILKISGGDELTLLLSYYVWDNVGSKKEAFVSGNYLIVPDGMPGGGTTAQVWLNKWAPGRCPSEPIKTSEKGGGGGGCSASASIFAAVLLVPLISTKIRKKK